ncbi:hypothetical protein ACIP3A_30455 [Streptomyces tricolor]|uniref:hypothetical protein n=1 Tax=Streptomyces TaxID=1883 RepID=UPI000A48E0DF|nr:hypothetical protein [Streptomyces sp. PBH53]
MNATDTAAAPICDRLIAERGDIVADVQRVAEQTRREAADALDFSSPGSDGGE